ncbi:MAG TPA: enoyl-CoA hydratase-related protein [Methylomirabilota bacterium]|jgi:enoyl-CoA hydratase/carnithine racemase|nr:enoyl-CoA hydratase-related protein [Methylomirabilota bacterium]
MEIVGVAGLSVALVAGRCAGSDFERLLDADMRVAGDGATFSADGVADPVACAVRLARLLGEAGAKELMLAARTLDAAAALRLGLVTRVVPGAVLGDTARALVEALGALPPLALAAVRDAVRAARDLTLGDALRLEHEHFRRLIATSDHKAAVAAFFARREAAFTGE